MACYSARAGGMHCRRGRAAASSAATRLATQLLACWASPWRPHPQQALRREDKTPSRRGKLPFPRTSTPTSSLRPSNSPFSLPFQATRAHQQLRQELSNRLRPLSQALTPHSPQPSRSPPTLAGIAAVGVSPRPDLLRASPPPLLAPLKSR